MKTKYPSLFGILAALMLVVSFVVPTSLVNPANVAADPGICKWDTLREPNALYGLQAIANFSDIIDLAVGSDFNTMYAIVNSTFPSYAASDTVLFQSSVKGLLWSGGKWSALVRETQWVPGNNLYQVAVAPDNPNFVAVTSDNGTTNSGPKQVWVSQNGGSDWDFTNFAINLGVNETIRCIDISVDYGGKRDIAVGTTTGTGGGRIFTVKSTGFSGWLAQTTTAPGNQMGNVDFFAVKFSPSYASDASMAVVYADNTTASTTCPATVAGATYYNVALRDIDQNAISLWAFPAPGIEVRDATWAVGASPSLATLNKADLELPSDFSGQAASLRRAYISLDALVLCTTAKPDCDRDGIFRIDDTTPYTLMDTHSIMDKSIYSIAYFGTYASGKLLAGERLGYPCTATVPTWFTDSPTTCPIPCWYPALKPTTGAANQGQCTVASKCGVGAAIVAWAPPGTLAYAATGALAYTTGTNWFTNLIVGTPTGNDESALAISRNNGETWNQVSFIDTVITRFTDIAPTPDCKTIYLASVSGTARGSGCAEFDSVWRSTLNPDVASPIAAQPVGILWERVFTHVTAANCEGYQTNAALLRLVPYCADPTGEIVAWAVYDTDTGQGTVGTHGVAAWSPDFGDYWAMLTPRNPVQDFTFESRTVMYFLSFGGLVQKMPYTGTAWSSSLANVDTGISRAHTIAAYPEGKVLVGAEGAYSAAAYSASYSGNMNTDNPSFTVAYLAGSAGNVNVHVAFDPNFKDNNIYYIATGGGPYNAIASNPSVYRNNPAAMLRWSDTNMMSALNGAVGCPSAISQYGIALAFTGQALYSADAGTTTAGAAAAGTKPLLLYITTTTATASCNVTATTWNGTTAGTATWLNIPAGTIAGTLIAPTTTSGDACDVTNVTGAFTGVTAGAATIVAQGGFTYATVNLVGGLWTDGISTCQSATAATSTPSGVNRTIDDGTGQYGPLSSMPKPGIAWDRLATGLTSGVHFTLEPSSLKICGCCTLDTDSTLYAIDNANYSPGTAGLIWAFTDCMAKRGPALVTEDKTLIGCDPVSGRAQEVNLCWEQLCVANAYDIEIAKSADFTIRIIDWASEACNAYFLTPADVTAPCVFFPAGGEAFTTGSSLAAWGNLECGHTYYWRVKVRQCATSQIIRSPWSEVRSFTVKAGLPTVSTYLGLTLLAPNNGCLGCPVQPASFSWSPFKETTKYKFVLASDAAMTQIVKEAETATTAYEYDGKLNYSTNYFWRVMSEEPAPSDWSATFSFQTEAAPVAAAAAPTPAPTPLWVWVVIAIGAILVIVTLVLIFKTRRV